ncbi:MAG TPA: hypothetical protein VFA64_10540 [Hyphomicrobiaceae bacterium]|nr:hypothetical protein [Hyphomicrobiaceae bacterium]
MYAVATEWAVQDGNGRLLTEYTGGTQLDVARKLLGRRYDAFRLQVSRSYREVFDRELRNVLDRQAWRIVRLRRSRRPAPSPNEAQLALDLH